MIGFWNSLSPFTRALSVIVVVCSILGGYGKLRLQPLRVDLTEVRKLELELGREVRQSRQRVAQLRRESDSALRWESYANILEEQSTGRSLREVLATCGTESGPQVSVLNAHFERQTRSDRFGRIAAELSVRGSYASVIDLLDELDRSFPPIEFMRVELRRPQAEERQQGATIVADLHGVIHEPR